MGHRTLKLGKRHQEIIESVTEVLKRSRSDPPTMQSFVLKDILAPYAMGYLLFSFVPPLILPLRIKFIP